MFTTTIRSFRVSTIYKIYPDCAESAYCGSDDSCHLTARTKRKKASRFLNHRQSNISCFTCLLYPSVFSSLSFTQLCRIEVFYRHLCSVLRSEKKSFNPSIIGVAKMIGRRGKPFPSLASEL